jgi:hypothetical protein
MFQCVVLCEARAALWCSNKMQACSMPQLPLYTRNDPQWLHFRAICYRYWYSSAWIVVTASTLYLHREYHNQSYTHVESCPPPAIVIPYRAAVICTRNPNIKVNKKFREELLTYFPWYDKGHIENEVSNNSSIVTCAFIITVNVSTDPLPSNNRGIFTEMSRYLATIRGCLPSSCLATIGGIVPSLCLATMGGYTNTHAHRQQA